MKSRRRRRPPPRISLCGRETLNFPSRQSNYKGGGGGGSGDDTN